MPSPIYLHTVANLLARDAQTLREFRDRQARSANTSTRSTSPGCGGLYKNAALRHLSAGFPPAPTHVRAFAPVA
jgi:hypothetical protein